MKLLLFLLVLLAIYWVFWGRHRRGERGPRIPPNFRQGDPEDMVTCAYCGVHLPRSESIPSGENFYCCDEHRRQHSR